VRKADLFTVWEAGRRGPAEANLGKITDIIACPGLDYCTLANARSIPVAQKIAERMADKAEEIGAQAQDFRCINACGHHHAATSASGVDRRVWKLPALLGG
jgi:sulfite reductase (NADPH) hemoprotein beta-component